MKKLEGLFSFLRWFAIYDYSALQYSSMVPNLLIRVHEWDISDAGRIYGLVALSLEVWACYHHP